MRNKAQVIVKRIGDWYLLEYGMYLRIYESHQGPTLAPKVHSRQVGATGNSYHTIVHGVGAVTIHRDKKAIWPLSHVGQVIFIRRCQGGTIMK
jgi:hypothetical protein